MVGQFFVKGSTHGQEEPGHLSNVIRSGEEHKLFQQAFTEHLSMRLE